MAEGTSTPISSERQSDPYRGSEGPRGDRSSGPREAGGFRIRLSDNEMRSARALQEAFGLRSTVAVLGFALRTLGQQLEEGKLDELAAQHRAQMGARPGGGGGRPEGRRERPEGGRPPGGRWQEGRGGGGRGQKVDPFARPSRPAAAEESPDEPPVEQAPEELLSAEATEVPRTPLDSEVAGAAPDPEE
ncbi:MAG: hypothetical protein ACKOYH_01045 [Cyanobium sp.]